MAVFSFKLIYCERVFGFANSTNKDVFQKHICSMIA